MASAAKDSSGVFQGMLFVVDLLNKNGIPDMAANQHLENEILSHGGSCTSSNEYVSSVGNTPVTHVVVSHMAQASVQAAQADGKELVSEYWIKARCKFQHPPHPDSEIFWRPRPFADNPCGSEDLVICITGYTGVERKMLTFACQWAGFFFNAQLSRGSTTHLLCFQHSGAKWDAARKWAAESLSSGGPGRPHVVNHRWLVDCLTAWEVLPAERYTHHSGEALMQDPSLLPLPWYSLHGRPDPSLAELERQHVVAGSGSSDTADYHSAVGATATACPVELSGPDPVGKKNSPAEEPAVGLPQPGSSSLPGQAGGKQAGQGEATQPSHPSGPSDPEAYAEAQATTAQLVETLDPRPAADNPVTPQQPKSHLSLSSLPTVGRPSGLPSSVKLPVWQKKRGGGSSSSGAGPAQRTTERLVVSTSAAVAAAGPDLGPDPQPEAEKAGGAEKSAEKAEAQKTPEAGGAAAEVGNASTGTRQLRKRGSLAEQLLGGGSLAACTGGGSLPGPCTEVAADTLLGLDPANHNHEGKGAADPIDGRGSGGEAGGKDSRPAEAEQQQPAEGGGREEAGNLVGDDDEPTEDEELWEMLDMEEPRTSGGGGSTRRGRGSAAVASDSEADNGGAEGGAEEEEEVVEEEVRHASKRVHGGGKQVTAGAKRSGGRQSKAADEGRLPPKKAKKTPAAPGVSTSAAAVHASMDRPACLALSGFHTEAKRRYTDAIHQLGAAKSRKSDSHAWDDEVTHLIMPELRRGEKSLAGMAAGAWLLSCEFLDVSLMEGHLQQEANFELEICKRGNAELISKV